MSAHPDADTRRTVVFVLNGLAMGGAESQLTSLLEASVDRRDAWRPTVLTLTRGRDEELEARLCAAGVRIETVDRADRSFLAFFVALRRWFRSERPMVVHTFLSGTAGTWGRIAARLAGVPTIVHSDRSLRPRRSPWQIVLEPLAHRLSRRVFTNARAVARRLRSEGVPRRKIRVLPNGVNLNRYDHADGRAYREAWGVGPNDFVVGYLGMLRREKRPDLLLDAVLALPIDERPDRVVFTGDGELRESLHARVESESWLREHVRWTGIVRDAPDFLAAIDVLTLTSDTEGLPNALIEAMAVGTPCIATRVSDVPDLLSGHGILIDAGDAGALAVAVRDMRAMKAEKRRELGSRARERIARDHSIEAAADRFWRAHDEVMVPES